MKSMRWKLEEGRVDYEGGWRAPRAVTLRPEKGIVIQRVNIRS